LACIQCRDCAAGPLPVVDLDVVEELLLGLARGLEAFAQLGLQRAEP